MMNRQNANPWIVAASGGGFQPGSLPGQGNRMNGYQPKSAEQLMAILMK